jgi:hypothetical protein
MEHIRFYGKNITVTSTKQSDFNIVASTIIDYGVVFDGTEEPNCTLTGFRINGRIYGGVNHTHATISHCLFGGNITPEGIVISNCDGRIMNCLVAGNGPMGDAIASPIWECHGLIKNCTVAGNLLGIRVGEGTTIIENCIIYDNFSWQISVDSQGTVNILYSNVEGGLNGIYGDGIVNWGPGNMDTDPCFADWYYIKSQAGRWNPNEGRWTIDEATSPCIDAGNPMSPIGLESFPNGGRINMGAYCGTAEASKSYFGQPVCETIVAADINGDCKVNFLDFQLMALHWLGGEPYIPDIPNKPPVVYITKPPNDVNICYESVIEIEADASDEDGVVVKVDFFANESKIGEDNNGTDGWKINWQNHPIGLYSLTAKATDNDDAETTSQPVEVILDEDCGVVPP